MSIPDETGNASAANERRIEVTLRSAVAALVQCGIFVVIVPRS